MENKRTIISKDVIEKKLLRMAYEIAERNSEEDFILLAGIRDSGYIIASAIKKFLQPIFKGRIELTSVTIDKKQPSDVLIEPAFNVTGKIVILVDDVANTGRTILYAVKPFLELYPKKIQTLVLVERTHKLFPIASDYVGLSVSTTVQENIRVEVVEGIIEGAFMD